MDYSGHPFVVNSRTEMCQETMMRSILDLIRCALPLLGPGGPCSLGECASLYETGADQNLFALKFEQILVFMHMQLRCTANDSFEPRQPPLRFDFLTIQNQKLHSSILPFRSSSSTVTSLI